MNSQSLRDRLAELMAQTDFTPPAPAPAPAEPPPPIVRAKTATPISRGRVSPHSTRCSHKWEVREGKRRCWLCGVNGAPLESDRPRVVDWPPASARYTPPEAPRQEGTTEELIEDATNRATALGHRLRPWKRRPNDQHGRANAYCAICNELVVVGDECAPGLPRVYGQALLHRCGTTGHR